ncbi:DNA repair protein XRCC3 [Bombina bombina]|uniref:DNA repair protein XRCC3 n=1 Tax=Bombina bombina TaxID=8345 RepID=UPI00235AADB4|nr:DNA repair protein XRCC3 [Bombina bombina]
MDWEQLDLNPRIIEAVRRANLKSVQKLLSLSGPELQKLTKLSVADVHRLQKSVSASLKNNAMTTALQMSCEKSLFPSQHVKLSLGCRVLDKLLRGGIPLVGITELAGESAAGKTQIALQLCLSVQFPIEYGGLGAGAVYICTEDAFPSKRLHQLIYCQHKLRTDVPADVMKKIRFGDNIFIEHTADIDMLTECITKKVLLLLLRGSIRLIVIDSIAALFRSEFAAKDSVLKAKHLQTLGAKLHSLSSQFNTPVLCINQVTDAVREVHGIQSNLGMVDKRVSPALGISWSNQLLMRLMVERTQQIAPQSCDGSVLRTMEVIFAPHIPPATCYYMVNAEGVRGLEGIE